MGKIDAGFQMQAEEKWVCTGKMRYFIFFRNKTSNKSANSPLEDRVTEHCYDKGIILSVLFIYILFFHMFISLIGKRKGRK